MPCEISSLHSILNCLFKEQATIYVGANISPSRKMFIKIGNGIISFTFHCTHGWQLFRTHNVSHAKYCTMLYGMGHGCGSTFIDVCNISRHRKFTYGWICYSVYFIERFQSWSLCWTWAHLKTTQLSQLLTPFSLWSCSRLFTTHNIY